MISTVFSFSHSGCMKIIQLLNKFKLLIVFRNWLYKFVYLMYKYCINPLALMYLYLMEFDNHVNLLAYNHVNQ